MIEPLVLNENKFSIPSSPLICAILIISDGNNVLSVGSMLGRKQKQ